MLGLLDALPTLFVLLLPIELMPLLAVLISIESIDDFALLLLIDAVFWPPPFIRALFKMTTAEATAFALPPFVVDDALVDEPFDEPKVLSMVSRLVALLFDDPP